MAAKRMIEVDDATATALETRAAETGVSVQELLAAMVAMRREPVQIASSDLADLDRLWTAIKAGEPTIPHEDVVRWLDTWGTPSYRPWADR